jgi:exodeoxyribonuclease VIII
LKTSNAQICFEDYRKNEALNISLLNHIHRSPAHLKWEKDHPTPSTSAQTFGQAFHKLLLEPFDFPKEFAVMPVCDRRTKAGKEIYEKFSQEHAGKALLSEDDMMTVQNMIRRVKEHSLVENLYVDSTREQSLFWSDPKTALPLKARLDLSKLGLIIDFKTTTSAETKFFEREIFRYSYYRQAAWYRWAYESVVNICVGFFIIAVEKGPPYGVNVFRLSEELLTLGEQENRRALDLYAKCLEENDWPSYDEGPKTVELPKWKMEIDCD